MTNWFITGISRGFGKMLAQELLAQGHNVVGTTRSGTSDIQHKNLLALKLDVTDAAACDQVMQHAHKQISTIDVIVNNAGFGIVGAVEEVSRDEMAKVFETNVYGTLNVMKAGLPFLRQQRKGRIVNFSSVGGFTGIPGFGAYNASKFAVEGMSEALAAEVKPLGIHVVIVEPGAFRTDFLTGTSLIRAEKLIEDYKATSGQTRNYANDRDGKQPGDPSLGVKVIIEAVLSETPPLRLSLGQDSMDRIRTKLKQVEGDIASWESRSKATAFAA